MRKLRLLLFPFAGVYYAITLARNMLYDAGILSSRTYALPVICIGNLSVGGTGKSPMTEFVIRLLKNKYQVATLSRGYGRASKGYKDVHPHSQATEVGDEPLQFAQKFKDIQVAVCEDRQEGIKRLLSKPTSPQVILLDDAYQHRKVKAGFYIVLTPYGDLYSNDYLLPAGNLREPRGGASRADIVVVTKCPEQVSQQEQRHIEKQLGIRSHQELFFSKIRYSEEVYGSDIQRSLKSLKTTNITLVTGIANPQPLLSYLQAQGLFFSHKAYGDHHNFTNSEIRELEKVDCILTTEKDYVRLRPLLQLKSLFYLPIRVCFLGGDDEISKKIERYVTTVIT